MNLELDDLKVELNCAVIALRNILDLCDGREDIVVGPEGRQLPNEWLRIARLAREGLKKT